MDASSEATGPEFLGMLTMENAQWIHTPPPDQHSSLEATYRPDLRQRG